MFERIRFARYALRFERAVKTDDWAAVRACFAPDATYVIAGTGTEYDCENRGPDAIVAFFKRMLDALDRRYDRRSPAFDGFPRVRGGELVLPWKARYALGEHRVWITGVTRCTFRGGLIHRLHDTMHADEVRRWTQLLEKLPARTSP